MRELTEYEENLIELVHFLSFGSKAQYGLALREVKKFLVTPVRDKRCQTPLDLIEQDGKAFLNELKTFINEIEDNN